MGEIQDDYIYYNIKVTFDTVRQLCAELYFFKPDVDAIQGKYIVDAKSIMGLFSLDLTRSITLRIHKESVTDKQIKEFENMIIPCLI